MSVLFGLGCFGGFVIAVFSAVYVIIRNPRSALNRFFLFTATASAIYNLGEGLYFLADDPIKIVPLHHVTISAWLVFLVAQLFFSVVLARREGYLPDRLLLGAASLLALALAIVDWLGTYIYLVPVASIYGLRSFPGPYYYYFTGFSIVVAVMQFSYFGAACLAAKDNRQRQQIVTVMIGLAVGAAFGVYFDIIAPLFGFFSQSFGFMASSAYVASFAYAMVRYEMLAVTPGTVAEDVLNTMPDLLVVIGPEGVISLVNQRVISVLGFPLQELIGKKLEWLLASPGAETNGARIEDSFGKSGLIKQLPAQLRCLDGRTFPARMDGSVARDRFGNELGKVLIFHDITEERQLLAKQEKIIAELIKAKEELEKITKLMEGREDRIIELKAEIEALKGEPEAK